MFLQAVDTVLAFSMIMLLLSVLVTVVVQMFISLFGLRGYNLLFGLEQLVGTVAPDLDEAQVQALANKVFHNPALRAGVKRTAVEVEAKEVLMVLDSIRKGAELEPEIKEKLDKLFATAASESSKLGGSLELLQSLRTAAPEKIEALQKLTDSALDGAKEIVVRIDTWFDSAMNHASERLKLHARWITGFCAVVLAVGLQVDSVSILNQLWNDPEATTQFVIDAEGAMELYKESQLLDAAPAKEGETPPTAEQLAARREFAGRVLQPLDESGLTIFATLSKSGFSPSFAAIAGSVLSALLLSLGAPFWYGMVGKIVGFRSSAAGKTKVAQI